MGREGSNSQSGKGVSVVLFFASFGEESGRNSVDRRIPHKSLRLSAFHKL